MKRIFIIGLVLIFSMMLTAEACFAVDNKIKIGVTTIVSHPALDAVQKGFEDALKDAGLDVVYDYQNAHGEMQNALAIAQKFKADDSITLVHAIATPTAQAVVKMVKNKPIVYDSVTDPVGAGLVKSLAPSGNNVTGLSDAWDIQKQIDTYITLVPKAKKWGTIYNAGDQNSVNSISRTKLAMAKLDLELTEMTVSSSNEVYTVAQTLVNQVDAIYISSDNIVVSAFEAVVKACNSKKVPLFAGDAGSVERGAILALGYNYRKTGYAAGQLAVQILKDGKKPGDIASIRVADVEGILELHLNLKAAKAQGVAVTPEFVQKVKDSGGKVWE